MGRRMVLINSILALLLALSGTSLAAEPQQLAIGSGGTAGVYYAASAALAKIFNRSSGESGLRLVNQASQGSEQNINDVLAGKAAFGLAQADMLYKATQGLGPWQGHMQGALRSVLALHSEALTLVAAEDSGIAGLADLKGKRVNIGAPGSSDNENARLVLEMAGVKLEEVKLREERAALASDLFQNDEIDAYFFTVGHPNLSVREATSGKRKARIVPLPAEMIGQFTAARPFLQAVSIPVDQYPGLANREPVPTIGVTAVLFARFDLDEKAVRLLVRTVLENLDLFRRQYPALSALTAAEMASAPVLLRHPGAESYFREAGLLR